VGQKNKRIELELLQKSAVQFIAVSHQKTKQSSVSWAYDNGKFPADFGPQSWPNLLSFLNARNGHGEFLGCENRKARK